MIPDAVRAIDRPDPALLKLYLLRAALPYSALLLLGCFTYGATVPVIAATFLPLYIRYHTLRYRFDEAGVSVSWGYLFRSETYLTYEKIQDIHLSRGVFERWLGIGTVDIQTAAGSASAEESLVGLRAFESVRDYLYGRMRVGLRPGTTESTPAPAPPADAPDALLAVLNEIRVEVAALRKGLEAARHE